VHSDQPRLDTVFPNISKTTCLVKLERLGDLHCFRAERPRHLRLREICPSRFGSTELRDVEQQARTDGHLAGRARLIRAM
jgi:hypothetical protein